MPLIFCDADRHIHHSARFRRAFSQEPAFDVYLHAWVVRVFKASA